MQVQSLVVTPQLEPTAVTCHDDKRRSPLAQTGGGCEAGWPGLPAFGPAMPDNAFSRLICMAQRSSQTYEGRGACGGALHPRPLVHGELECSAPGAARPRKWRD